MSKKSDAEIDAFMAEMLAVGDETTASSPDEELQRQEQIRRCLEEGRCLLEDCPIHGGPNPEGER